MMVNDYQAMEADARRKIAEGEQAERARIERENAAQQQIDEGRRQLERIAEMKRRDAVQSLQQQNTAVVEDILALHVQVIAALERGDCHQAVALVVQDDAAWNEHDRLRRDILAAQGELVINPRDLYPAAQRLGVRQAWGIQYALLEWIADAPDATERQIRQGLSIAAAGTAFANVANPKAGYRAADAYRQDNTGGWF